MRVTERPADPGGRCLHLLPDTDDAGAENQCRYLLTELIGRGGFEPELAYFEKGRAHAGFEATGVAMSEVARRGRVLTDGISRARRLRALVGANPPDILHTWLLEGNVVGLAAARAWPQTKVVITQRGSWNELDYPGIVRLQRLLLRRADAAISNSRDGAQMLESIGMKADRIHVIANGIPMSRVASASDPAKTRAENGWSDRQVIGWVGRVSDRETLGQKDLATLFKAVRRLRESCPDVTLALIGPSHAELADAGQELPQWAEPLGWHANPGDLIRACDLVALSSRREGSSNGVGEALLAGLPVVSTDCGDHVDTVRACGGRVVDVGDATEFATAISQLLDDPPPPATVSEAAAALYSPARVAAETIAVYESLQST